MNKVLEIVIRIPPGNNGLRSQAVRGWCVREGITSKGILRFTNNMHRAVYISGVDGQRVAVLPRLIEQIIALIDEALHATFNLIPPITGLVRSIWGDTTDTQCRYDGTGTAVSRRVKAPRCGLVKRERSGQHHRTRRKGCRCVDTQYLAIARICVVTCKHQNHRRQVRYICRYGQRTVLGYGISLCSCRDNILRELFTQIGVISNTVSDILWQSIPKNSRQLHIATR